MRYRVDGSQLAMAARLEKGASSAAAGCGGWGVRLARPWRAARSPVLVAELPLRLEGGAGAGEGDIGGLARRHPVAHRGGSRRMHGSVWRVERPAEARPSGFEAAQRPSARRARQGGS